MQVILKQLTGQKLTSLHKTTGTPCERIRISESAKFLLVKSETLGIRNPRLGDWNPVPGVQNPRPRIEIHRPSRIYLPRMG